MNDFTKEELIFLRDSFLHRISNSGLFEYNDYELLHEKIQSMIDNYCDHEDICGGNHMYVIDKCASCGERKMIISEKQIMQLIRFSLSLLTDSLTDAGEEHFRILLHQIEEQQSEELKEIK